MINRMDPTRRLLLPFRLGVLGRVSIRSFRGWHNAKLAFGQPICQEAKRFKRVNSEVLTTPFAFLEKLIRENTLDAERIFNLDKTTVIPERDLHGVTSSKRFMPRSGCPDLCIPDFRNLKRVSLMPVISASGACAHPLLIF